MGASSTAGMRTEAEGRGIAVEMRQEVVGSAFAGRGSSFIGADDERHRREELERTASQLAAMVAREHTLLERERIARERAENEAEQLRELLFTTERRLAHRRR
jgi:hypothetical protein